MSPIIPVPTDIPNEGAENDESSSANDNPINVMSESDSNSEDDDHDGYEPLSQDPDNYIESYGDFGDDTNFLPDEESMNQEMNAITHHSLLLPAPAEESDIQQMPSELNMDEDRIETIKAVMKSITLPTSNLPQWATSVPEEEWKAALLSTVLSRKNLDTKNEIEATPRNLQSSDFSSDVVR